MSAAAPARVALLFGGRSAEHEVSLLSARNVADALRAAGYDLALIAIDRQGRWFLTAQIASPEELPAAERQGVALVPGGNGTLLPLDGGAAVTVDAVFPVLHGPYGEDGTVQGLCKLANVAFVGPGLLGSAVGMDKDVSKRLLRDAGIPIVKFLAIQDPDEAPEFATVKGELGMPIFVKPANLGSSVGISKVHDEAEYAAALALAFRYDRKILLEADAEGREIECAVLGLDVPTASLPGEIVPAGNHGFYTYDCKYTDDKGADLHAPANLPEAVVKQVQALSLATCAALCCDGMTRVDFFLKATGELLVNEVNTIPGFTAISMYPKLWDVSGMPPAAVVGKLVDHALRRFQAEQTLDSNRDGS